jgi:hypothetical protein
MTVPGAFIAGSPPTKGLSPSSRSRAAVDVKRLLAARPGADTVALLPTSLDGLYGMIYGLLAAIDEAAVMARALAIVDQLPQAPARVPLPLREAQTLAMELLMQRALALGLETVILDSEDYARHLARRGER